MSSPMDDAQEDFLAQMSATMGIRFTKLLAAKVPTGVGLHTVVLDPEVTVETVKMLIRNGRIRAAVCPCAEGMYVLVDRAGESRRCKTKEEAEMLLIHRYG